MTSETVTFTEQSDCAGCGCVADSGCGHFDCRCWSYPTGGHFQANDDEERDEARA